MPDDGYEFRRPTMVYMAPTVRRSVDEWRREQPDIPSRSAAIQRLLEQALAASSRRAGQPA